VHIKIVVIKSWVIKAVFAQLCCQFIAWWKCMKKKTYFWNGKENLSDKQHMQRFFWNASTTHPCIMWLSFSYLLNNLLFLPRSGPLLS